VQVDAHAGAQSGGDLLPYACRDERAQSPAVGGKEVQISAGGPGLPLDGLQLGSRWAEVQAYQHRADLVVLERIERCHHEVDQPAIPVAGHEQHRVLKLRMNWPSQAGRRPVGWRLAVKIGFKPEANSEDNDIVDAPSLCPR